MSPVTWEELANVYDRHNGGRRARTLKMTDIYLWATTRKDLFRVDPKGYLFRVDKGD